MLQRDFEVGGVGCSMPDGRDVGLPLREVSGPELAVLDDVASGHSPDGPALAQRLPDVNLVADLLGCELDALDDFALVETVAAWRRIESWAAAHVARAAAVLSERASMNPFWPAVAGPVKESCVAGEEIALRLGCSRRAARELIACGRAFDGALWLTGDALEGGEIDERKARILVTALAPVPGQVAVAVQEEVLERAGRRTHSELAADIQRALIRVDPDDATERAARATRDRRVCRPRVLPDGMAGIWAVLPAPAAVALDSELDAVARRVRGLGDARTLDQLRADALCYAVIAHRSPASIGAPRAATDGSATDGSATDAEADTDGRPVETDGTADPLGDILVGPPLGAHVQVTVPLDALLGVRDGSAELAGYGAIDPATAEAIARGGTWARLVTDPLSGTVLDVGRTRYRPPPGLDRHVRTRDGTCVRPGCSTSAWSCDLDHTVPFDPAGATSADNLGALCRREHLLKTHGGFGLRQVAPGVFEWTTPTGHRYAEPSAGTGGAAAADEEGAMPPASTVGAAAAGAAAAAAAAAATAARLGLAPSPAVAPPQRSAEDQAPPF